MARPARRLLLVRLGLGLLLLLRAKLLVLGVRLLLQNHTALIGRRIGDRAGNGLNLNVGVGVGGVDYNSNSCCSSYSSASGLALAGGLSYDARVTPWFSLSPEFFVTWHEIPNGAPVPHDVASAYGLRLNFLWYLK